MKVVTENDKICQKILDLMKIMPRISTFVLKKSKYDKVSKENSDVFLLKDHFPNIPFKLLQRAVRFLYNEGYLYYINDGYGRRYCIGTPIVERSFNYDPDRKQPEYTKKYEGWVSVVYKGVRRLAFVNPGGEFRIMQLSHMEFYPSIKKITNPIQSVTSGVNYVTTEVVERDKVSNIRLIPKLDYQGEELTMEKFLDKTGTSVFYVSKKNDFIKVSEFFDHLKKLGIQCFDLGTTPWVTSFGPSLRSRLVTRKLRQLNGRTGIEMKSAGFGIFQRRDPINICLWNPDKDKAEIMADNFLDQEGFPGIVQELFVKR